MASTRQIMIVVLAVTIGAILFIPFASTISENTGEVSETENVTADLGNYVDLGGYELVSGSVDVSNASGNSISDTEYEVNQTEGSLKIDSGTTAVSDGEELNVTYDYQATDTQTTQVATLLPLLLGLLLLVAMAGRIMDMM